MAASHDEQRSRGADAKVGTGADVNVRRGSIGGDEEQLFAIATSTRGAAAGLGNDHPLAQ
ncbi:MAG: hypothetical protein ABI818_03400 [Acidobacteriota bacterium]